MHRSFDISFYDQFRDIILEIPGESEYQGITVKTYAGPHQKIDGIGKILISYQSLTNRESVIELLQTVTVPYHSLAIAFAGTMVSNIARYLFSEPYTATYYRPVLSELHQITKDVGDSLTHHAQLLEDLTGSFDFTAESVDLNYTHLEQWMSRLKQHYSIVHSLIDNTPHHSQIILTTQMDDSLIQLADFLGSISNDCETLLEQLDGWRLQFENWHTQSVYN